MTGDEDNRKAPPDNDLCVSKDIIQEEAMRHPQYTLSPSHVQAHTTYRLQKHPRLKDHGPKCRAGTLWIVLCYAVSRLVSLAAACAALRDTPSDSAANDALLATPPQLRRTATTAQPRPARRSASRPPPTRQPFAIDLIPYRGQPCTTPVWLSSSGPGPFEFSQDAGVVATLGRSTFWNPR